MLQVFSSFSELGSEEEDEEDEDEEEEEDEEEQEEWAVLLWGFSESLLSDRSDVMSVLSLLGPAFFSSSSPFLRLFIACLAFNFESLAGVSLSSSGILLSEPFLLDERTLRCSRGSRVPLPGEWLAVCWFCWVPLCCWDPPDPWEPLVLGPEEVMMGRGLLAWARV